MYIKLITSIIDKPYAKKPYLDFVEYLQSTGREQEALAFLNLIELRFPPNDNNPSVDSQ